MTQHDGEASETMIFLIYALLWLYYVPSAVAPLYVP